MGRTSAGICKNTEREREMEIALPKTLALKSKTTGMHLYYLEDETFDGGALSFGSAAVMNAHVKFQAEMAKCSGRDQLIHLRCCYNNKYLRRSSESTQWIVADSTHPEENPTKWSCTLFKPQRYQGNAIRFKHAYQDSHYLSQNSRGSCFVGPVDDNNDEKHTLFEIVDWDAIYMLPKYVAFKGDNGNYLRVDSSNDCLVFEARGPDDPNAAFATYTVPSGKQIIKSIMTDRYWGLSSTHNWIKVDHSESSASPFTPVEIDDKTVTLRLNNDICKRYMVDGMNGYAACDNTVSVYSKLEITELVMSRQIYNVRYRTRDARVYNTQVVHKASGMAVNTTKNTNTVNMKFTYKEVSASTWKWGLSGSFNIKTTLETGVPFIIKGKIEYGFTFTAAHEWGETMTTEHDRETSYTVVVPPQTCVKVDLIATQGYCDIPFGYTRLDVLMNGEREIINMNDGCYTGLSTYDFQFETSEEPLPKS